MRILSKKLQYGSSLLALTATFVLLPTSAWAGALSAEKTTVSNVTSNSATFKGVVRTTLDYATCWFEYSNTRTKTYKTEKRDCNGSTTFKVTGLKSGTIYSVRVAAMYPNEPSTENMGPVTEFGTQPSASDKKAKDYIPNDKVVRTVETVFGAIFGGRISPAESTYWKNRARTDAYTLPKLYNAMAYEKSQGRFMRQ